MTESEMNTAVAEIQASTRTEINDALAKAFAEIQARAIPPAERLTQALQFAEKCKNGIQPVADFPLRE